MDLQVFRYILGKNWMSGMCLECFILPCAKIDIERVLSSLPVVTIVKNQSDLSLGTRL